MKIKCTFIRQLQYTILFNDHTGKFGKLQLGTKGFFQRNAKKLVTSEKLRTF